MRTNDKSKLSATLTSFDISSLQMGPQDLPICRVCSGLRVPDTKLGSHGANDNHQWNCKLADRAGCLQEMSPAIKQRPRRGVQISCGQPRAIMETASTLELMDLPHDLLERIFLTLMNETTTFTNFALCNRRMLSILQQQRRAVNIRLCWRPWFIEGDTLVQFGDRSDYVRSVEPDILQHTLQHLQLGWVKRIELMCDTEGDFIDWERMVKLYGFATHISSSLVGEMVGHWPVNKVILSYGWKQFTDARIYYS